MKLSFKRVGEIKTFSNNQTLRKHITHRSVQEMLKEIERRKMIPIISQYRSEAWFYMKKKCQTKI